MTRIKICGITNVEDARAAVEYGAHALGFILVPDSPRRVTDDAAAEIGRHVRANVLRIGVCADCSGAREGVFGAVQYYTSGSGNYTRRQRIRAYRVRGEETLDEIASSHREAHTLLLDAYHPARLGGSGETFNWELALEAKARFRKPIILAGGLTPENVADAIAAVRPYAVDVSSGVEAEPGRKDHSVLRAFIRAVQRADDHLSDR